MTRYDVAAENTVLRSLLHRLLDAGGGTGRAGGQSLPYLQLWKLEGALAMEITEAEYELLAELGAEANP